MPKISRIMVHERPELDEAVAIFLLRRYGKNKFYGLGTAEIGFCPAGSQPPGHTADEWERQGVLYIGVGGGRFDHHAQVDQDRQAGHSATSLVARALRIQKRQELKALLDYVTRQELEGDPSPFGLSRMAHAIGEAGSTDPLIMFKWAWKAVSAYLDQNIHFFRDLPAAFAAGKRYKIGLDPATKKPIVLFVATSEEPRLKGYAFYRGARVAILSQATGHTSIFVSRPKEGSDDTILDLTPVAVAIRRAELREKGHFSWSDAELSREVGPTDVPEWYFHPDAGWLLNGSRTQSNVAATRLALDRIVGIVRFELSRQLEAAPAS